MFGGDEPPAEAPSPRTTIVGGRPPERTGAAPPVPTGIQRLLRLASVDGRFRQELLERRSAVASAAEVPLTTSERAILDTVPTAHLEAMIGGLPPPPADRREFLRGTAASAVLLLGGAALGTSCREVPRPEPVPVTGIRPDIPREPSPPAQTPPPDGAAPVPRPRPVVKGIRPDLPPSREGDE
jgi:hypothetical protein